MSDINLYATWAQIISAPLAIIAIIVSVWIYYRSLAKRALSCQFDSILSPVELRAGNALRGDIEIRYNGKSVDNLFIVRARLKNNGNLPITNSDIIEPVIFTYQADVELLRQPQVISKKPENLNVDWILGIPGNSKLNAAYVKFDLLNPTEEFVTEFLGTGSSTYPQVSARIQGVTKISIVNQEMLLLNAQRLIQNSLFFLGGIILLLTILYFSFGSDSINNSTVLRVAFVVFGLTSLFLLLFGGYKWISGGMPLITTNSVQKDNQNLR